MKGPYLHILNSPSPSSLPSALFSFCAGMEEGKAHPKQTVVSVGDNLLSA